MAKTDSYRKAHVDLLANVSSIKSKLTEAQVIEHSAEIRKELAGLAGKLTMHLTMEDNSLYPNMLSCGNADVERIAKSFQVEMGALKEVFGSYISKYPTPNSLKDNPSGFIKDTQKVFESLGKRIIREEADLYPKFESV